MNKKKMISEKELKYFSYSLKNASCLGKMYFIPKTQRQLYNVPGHQVILNCGTWTDKISKLLDHHLKPVMKSEKSHPQVTGDFLEKIKSPGRILKDAFLVTVCVCVCLFPSTIEASPD